MASTNELLKRLYPSTNNEKELFGENVKIEVLPSKSPGMEKIWNGDHTQYVWIEVPKPVNFFEINRSYTSAEAKTLFNLDDESLEDFKDEGLNVQDLLVTSVDRVKCEVFAETKDHRRWRLVKVPPELMRFCECGMNLDVVEKMIEEYNKSKITKREGFGLTDLFPPDPPIFITNHKKDMIDQIIAEQCKAGGYDTEGSRAQAERWLASVCMAMGEGLMMLTSYSRYRRVRGEILKIDFKNQPKVLGDPNG